MERFNEIIFSKKDYKSQFNYKIDDKDYIVQIVYHSINDTFNIPYVLVLPKDMDENSTLFVETNTLESDNIFKLVDDALLMIYSLTNKLKEYNNPILVPIIPSFENGIPYYQQLSRECFALSKDNPLYRIDLQILNMINSVKQEISKKTSVNEKVFLNGYSSSGVFAQRFALLHPEIVDTLCVGGAIGSIPVPINELEYPLGIANYFDITGKNFDLQSYSKIKFRYYVGSLEEERKSYERYDDDGNYAPMHDMSYFYRSVPTSVGLKQRQLFGKNIFERFEHQILMMNKMGLDIEQKIFEGRTHNDYNGKGVNELGDEFMEKVYHDSIISSRKI